LEHTSLARVKILMDQYSSIARIELVFTTDKYISVDIVDTEDKFKKNIFQGQVYSDYLFHHELDISEFESGIYFVKVTWEKQTEFHNFIFFSN
jgi:hypothetical protein